MSFRAAALAAVSCLACASGESALLVDVRTDLVPGIEFARVRTAYFSGNGMEPMREVTQTIDASDDFVDAHRVAELGDLPNGAARVVVALLDTHGAPVLSREVAVRIDGVSGVLVVLARTCRGVSCPTGDPAATTCAGGECVRPDCEGDACGPECAADGDCIPSAPCARARCIERQCLSFAAHESCALREICDPDIGCVPENHGGDGGVPCADRELDCTDLIDEDCDGRIDCADDECDAHACDDGDAMTADDACTMGACAGRPPDCDDENPCTVDSYEREFGCMHTESTDSCDDGVYCNGADTCSAGECNHAGSPCMDICRESTRTCEACHALTTMCAADSECCGIASCRRGVTFPVRCCGEHTQTCRNGADCCGYMDCVSGRCACRPAGRGCLDHRDCCSGTCTGTTCA
jgi:hypothetical protein